MNNNWILSLSSMWLCGPMYDIQRIKRSQKRKRGFLSALKKEDIVYERSVNIDTLEEHLSNKAVSTFIRILCSTDDHLLMPENSIEFLNGSSIAKQITYDRHRLLLLSEEQKNQFFKELKLQKRNEMGKAKLKYYETLIDNNSCFPKASLAAADIANGVMYLRILSDKAIAYDDSITEYLHYFGEKAAELYDNYIDFATDAAIGNLLINNYLHMLDTDYSPYYTRNLSRAVHGLYHVLQWNPE